jgi:hypothetical protein
MTIESITLLGIDLGTTHCMAGLGSGVYPNERSVAERLGGCEMERFKPALARHAVYRQLFERG